MSRFTDEVALKFGILFKVIEENKKDAIINCKMHGNVLINKKNFLDSKYGCPDCGNYHKNLGKKTRRKLSRTEFIKKAQNIHKTP